MRVPASTTVIAALAMVPFVGAGCGVQQDRYDTMIHSSRSLEEQNLRLADEADSAQANLQSVSRELTNARQRIQALESQLNSRDSEVQQMAGDYDQLMNKVSSLEFGPLPPDVERALSNLTRNYSDLMTFDANKGMLRFASDLTFELGSAEMQAEAEATISSLANILNSSNGSTLEVQVFGHTDNVPIGKPETRAKHPTNLHLSVHRAISVHKALTAAGVDPARIQVAGYGESRPIVANGARGAAENRRVEIFLAAMPGSMPQQPRMGGSDTTRDAMVPTNDPMK